MRILVSADMEGATGTVLPDDVLAGTDRYARALRLMLGDVNAAVAGFAAAGADEIVVNDSHCSMANLPLAELDPRAELVIGRHKPLGMMELIDTGVDAVAMVGYHMGAGRPGVLAHTCLSHTILDVRVDGRQVDEGGFNALVAAEAGVPVVLVTGDDVLCAAAREWAPRARTVAVKRALSRHSAVCRPPAATAADITAAARQAAALAGAGPAAPAPHTVEIDVDYPYLAVRAASIPGVRAVAERTVAFDAPDAASALRTFGIVVGVLSSGRERDWT
ncbi:M55 family metallopeptidase [Actinocatenispora comari]|uniref:Peptide ABC transporter substrate-binding protein n=1 Tax=Actinocatenispora comari TaxID=2807577 RepID=A0A8J4A8N8_9ACTN|nr:M55 family metallopeptidase [Actinocatenispora comari]GIL26954.1 peptide ABC transporter substrate-binding protein [Actinocatenispora comari]